MSNTVQQIAILGDSSSAGIGDGQDVYPCQLFHMLKRLGTIQMENWSSPGISSADAAKLFLQKLSNRNLNALIIYLGNNEGSQSPYKGTYRPGRNQLTEFFQRLTRRQQSRISRERQTFVFMSEPIISSTATTPTDFFNNVSQIVRQAVRDETEVLVINPRANRKFPAGLGTRNFPFYRFVNFPDTVGDELIPIDPSSETLVQGIRRHVEGDLKEAIVQYRRVTDNASYSYQIAQNNLAVALYEAGQDSEATVVFTELLTKPAYDRSILLYNFGLMTESQSLLHEAYETDISLYRIKDPYRAQISRVKKQFPVHLLDLETLVTNEHFVDYCHLTKAGHRTLAEHLCSKLVDVLSGFTDSGKGGDYQNFFPNPNYFFDARKELADYYTVSPQFDEAEILNTAVQVCAVSDTQTASPTSDEISHKGKPLVTAIERTVRNALRHPVFTRHSDLVRYPIRYRHEIGSFPEFYIYRVLCAYGHALKLSGNYERWKGWRDTLPLREPYEYERLILGQENLALEHDQIDLTPERRNRILARVEQQLAHPDFYRNRSLERRKTVIYWYTRESFRFGTQSRPSMLYDRVGLEHLAEGISVAWTIDALGSHALETDRIDKCRTKVQHLLEVHDRFSNQLVSKDHATVSQAYVDALQKLRNDFAQTSQKLCGQ